MIGIEWTMLAFEQLELLLDSVAAEIVRRVDTLAAFPEMGVRYENNSKPVSTTGS